MRPSRGGVVGNAPPYRRESGLGASRGRIRAAHHDEASGRKLQHVQSEQTVCGPEEARGQGDEPNPAVDKNGGVDGSKVKGRRREEGGGAPWCDDERARRNVEPSIPEGSTRHKDERSAEIDGGQGQGLTGDHGVDIMTATAAPMIEYALTKDVGAPDPKDAPSITVALSDATVLTIRRTSVDIRSDMCVWRGVVEATGASATLMWWPGGRMTGTVEHQGRIYSIRHMGGQMHAVVEMDELRMPPEHAAMTPRMRRDDPSLRDDPLVRQGDASMIKRPTSVPIHPSEAKSPVAGAQVGDAPPNDVVIDVIVAYTKKAASNYMDVK